MIERNPSSPSVTEHRVIRLHSTGYVPEPLYRVQLVSRCGGVLRPSKTSPPVAPILVHPSLRVPKKRPTEDGLVWVVSLSPTFRVALKVARTSWVRLVIVDDGCSAQHAEGDAVRISKLDSAAHTFFRRSKSSAHLFKKPPNAMHALHEHRTWRLSCPVSVIDTISTFFCLFSFPFLLVAESADQGQQSCRRDGS